MLEPSILLSIAIALIGGVVWAVRVEGKVNGHDKLFEEREKQMDDRHEDLQNRLKRIEDKLDRYNGNHAK